MRRRKGYILLAVLGVAAVVTALGLSFVESHATAMPESMNRYGSMRAQYLAESGIAIGSHFLMYPPTTVAFNQYYPGGNNIGVDASIDYTNITVLRSDGWSPPKTDPNLYRITAVGYAHDPDGSVRGKKQVTAEVLVPDVGKWRIPYAYFNRTGVTAPAAVKVYGSVHANGTLTGALGSFCNGKVSATGTALWLGGGPPTGLQSLAPAYTGPLGTLSKYQNYTIKGKSYTAYTSFTGSEIKTADAVALNAINMSATNPGRIIKCKDGNIKLRVDTDVTGTLLVTGDLEIDDAGSRRVRAVEGFPAIIVTGNIKFSNNDAVLTVFGSIICGNQVDLNNKDRASLVVTGSMILNSGYRDPRSDNIVRYTWDATRSWFWDVENPPTPQPITLLNWKED